MDKYDSREETLMHSEAVTKLLDTVAWAVVKRGDGHDASKLESPEKEAFDVYTPRLKETSYGSPEYRAYLKEMGEAVKHHYSQNRHHPEHFEHGVCDMTLVDVLEMLCDWIAASKRMKDGGSVKKSLETGRDRFKIEPQLMKILENTVKEVFGEEI